MPMISTFEISTQIILLKIDGFLKGWILNITPLKYCLYSSWKPVWYKKGEYIFKTKKTLDATLMNSVFEWINSEMLSFGQSFHTLKMADFSSYSKMFYYTMLSKKKLKKHLSWLRVIMRYTCAKLLKENWKWFLTNHFSNPLYECVICILIQCPGKKACV